MNILFARIMLDVRRNEQYHTVESVEGLSTLTQGCERIKLST